ncbi:unnamed protein product [Sphagnum troendelagicum]
MCVKILKLGSLRKLEDGGASVEEERGRVKVAQRCMTKANYLTTLSFTRWVKDWANATPLFEQAALNFKLVKMPEEAKLAYQQAAMGQIKQSSPWMAAKHMEAAGVLAKELSCWNEVVDFFKQASALYVECGKVQPGADALIRGARAVQELKPNDALTMYMDACRLLEDDNREQMAFDTYRAASNLYIKLNKYHEAAVVLLRWGQAANKCKATQSQCKAYLSAIIVYLYAESYEDALACYNNCASMDVFSKSDQDQCAQLLFSAYREGRANEIKHVISTSTIIPHLDHMIIRLAKQLPQGKVMSQEVPIMDIT